jgi:hypothetical protein
VVVPDKQLSLAIGKEGQNARLAAKLTGWRIDIKSVSAIEAEKAVSQELETGAEAIPTEIMEEEPLEEALAEQAGVEEPVEFPSIPETPPEKPEEKHIRFAEDILVGALKAKMPDKAKNGVKGKKKRKVIKHQNQDDEFVDDESGA